MYDYNHYLDFPISFPQTYHFSVRIKNLPLLSSTILTKISNSTRSGTREMPHMKERHVLHWSSSIITGYQVCHVQISPYYVRTLIMFLLHKVTI